MFKGPPGWDDAPMHEQFKVEGGPMDGQFVALEEGDDEEVIVLEGKVKHVYRTIVTQPRDESVTPVRRQLVYLGPNPSS